MTIVRVGLAETKNYGDGWNAIFARKTASNKPAKSPGRKKAKPAKKKKK